MNVENVVNYENEIAMYPDIMESIKFYMDLFGYECKVFETWHEFKPELRERFQREIDILGDFGKPDITVLYRKSSDEDYKVLLIEAKLNSVVMKDIAQAKMYGDIFKADKVFLVAPYELRRMIEQYYYVNKNIFGYDGDKEIKYVRLSDRNLLIQQSIPSGGELF